MRVNPSFLTLSLSKLVIFFVICSTNAGRDHPQLANLCSFGSENFCFHVDRKTCNLLSVKNTQQKGMSVPCVLY